MGNGGVVPGRILSEMTCSLGAKNLAYRVNNREGEGDPSKNSTVMIHCQQSINIGRYLMLQYMYPFSATSNLQVTVLHANLGLISVSANSSKVLKVTPSATRSGLGTGVSEKPMVDRYSY